MPQVSLRPKPTAAVLLDAARRELDDDILAGQGGTAALNRYSGRLDALVRQLYADAPPSAQPVAVAALGGFGRRQLCLHSDIDLLIVFAGPLASDDEAFLRALLHPLWDAGLAVGHQVREIDELNQLEVDNPEFLLALVDARLLSGDAALFARVEEGFHTPETHAHIVTALERLIDERHARFNDTLYQLEPDVKDAPGALRDIMSVRTIAALTDPSLLRQGPEGAEPLADAEDFFFRLRSILHFEGKRNLNVLTHALQERAAEMLGYPGAFAQQRVERLMGDYFRHARIVTRTLERTRRSAPVPVGMNLGRTANGVDFIDRARAAVQPATWLGLFQAAIDAGCSVADEALTAMRQHGDRFGVGDFFPTPEHRAALLRFLQPRPGLYDRLSEMHDCGLLGRMFPPFQAITYRVVRDFYHKYTVDEHTLLTIRNLERLAAPAPGRERFASLLQDLETPGRLVLALLLHDVGKWRDEDHDTESVRMARQLFEQLEMPPDTVELVEFLIANHLRMSQIAFRRDTEDPEIVRHFGELVGVEERLKMLCLLTLADVEAVSLETLTPWKEELLWRLYVDTYNQLTLGYGDDLIGGAQANASDLVARHPPDVTEAEIAHFLEGLPRKYLQLFPREAIYRHVRLSRDMAPDDVHLWLEPRGGTWELTVATTDKPLLFSNISGVLSSFGMNIFRGHAITNPNGLVLDVFQFTDGEQFLELNADAEAVIFGVLRDVVSGRSSVTERLRGREASLFHRRPQRFVPVVHCDNQLSRRYTIVEIVSDDALGLLYRISRMISQHECGVDLVLISTEGHKAIDVFHITKGGAKLTDDEQRGLAADLQRMLEAS
jgi:[protein-PII] uridylyltransferase